MQRAFCREWQNDTFFAKGKIYVGAQTSAQGILRVFRGGLRMLPFPAGKERSQGLVSNALDYQSPYASPFTHSPVARMHEIWRGRGACQKRGSQCCFFSNTQLELAASGIQIFRKTAANLEAVPEYARGTPHCEPYRQKYKRKSSSPLSEAGCCSTLLLGLDAVLDSLSNRSYWRP